MLSVSVVVFREVLEVALLLSLIFVATSDIKGRNKWIALGLGAGLLGSALFALFTESIANLTEDSLGHDLMGAIIIMIACALISITIIWLHKHSKNMHAHIKTKGDAIASGDIPLFSLSLIVFFAVIREGAEIILFLYSMLVSGEMVFNAIVGSAIGAVAGITFGVLVYLGFLRISTKYVFKITNGFLILLVSGLMGKAASKLAAVGYFEGYRDVLWDSSWLLNEHSMVGELMHGIIGYSAQPIEIQLVFFISTMAVLIAGTKLIKVD